MGKDELTRMQELAKRVTLLEKMALRQQSRLDELMKRVEQAERGTPRPPKRPIEKAELPPYEEPLSTAVESADVQQGSPSISDFMDEDMKEDLARAYGSQPLPEKKKEKQQKKPSEPTASEMERAVDSYEKAKGDKESIQSDREKQNEAVRQKTAETATLEQIPTVELREKTPAERAAEYIRDYNALYDVKGTMFQKKKAQDDFIRQYEVQGHALSPLWRHVMQISGGCPLAIIYLPLSPIPFSSTMRRCIRRAVCVKRFIQTIVLTTPIRGSL